MSTNEQPAQAMMPRRELSEEEKNIIAARQGGHRFTPEEERKIREKGKLLKMGSVVPIRGDDLITFYRVIKTYGPKSKKPPGAVLMAPVVETRVLSQIQKAPQMIRPAGPPTSQQVGSHKVVGGAR
jgi:hypothetical protein